jgi:hypothetical protein
MTLIAGCEPGSSTSTTEINVKDNNATTVNLYSSDINDTDSEISEEEIAAAVKVEKDLSESE